MATKGTGWVIKRSTDLVPYLVLMGLRELWATADPEPGTVWTGDSAGKAADTEVTGS